MALGLAGMLAGSEAKAAPLATPKSASVEVQRAAPKEVAPDARSLQDLAARLDKAKKALNVIERRLGRTPEQFLDEAVRRLGDNAQEHLNGSSREQAMKDLLLVSEISDQAADAFGDGSRNLADSLRRLSPSRAPRPFANGIRSAFDEDEPGANPPHTSTGAAPRPFANGIRSAFDEDEPGANPPHTGTTVAPEASQGSHSTPLPAEQEDREHRAVLEALDEGPAAK